MYYHTRYHNRILYIHDLSKNLYTVQDIPSSYTVEEVEDKLVVNMFLNHNLYNPYQFHK